MSTEAVDASRSHVRTLRSLLPHIWPKGDSALRMRVVAAIVCLVLAKVAVVTVPIFFATAVDSLAPSDADAVAFLPLWAIVGYGIARVLGIAFAEMRDGLFARVAQRAIRTVALEIFRHLHSLALRFHLERQTGGLSRVIERGTKAIETLLSFSLFSVLPTALEILLVAGILWALFDGVFALITCVAVGSYIAFTMIVTEWRLKYRRKMNESDQEANTKAIDSLLNFETVKYFGNEVHEANRFNEALRVYEDAAVNSRTSLALLNTGQAVIIAAGLALVMYLAGMEIVDGTMTVGGFVLVNTYLMQLYQPLNFFGFVYREIKRALADMEAMFVLLTAPAEITDPPSAPDLEVREGRVAFENVRFDYDPRRPILDGVDITIPGGATVAVVGPTGAGKSTLARLMFRFYDVTGGRITIDGQDIREITQSSLRSSIGVVPQDTVLFNDTIYYNIAYGRPSASPSEIEAAARLAQIHDLHHRPAGWLPDPRRRAGPEAFRRGEAAGGHRPNGPQAPANPDLRRGDIGAGYPYRAGNPGKPARSQPGPHHLGHRPSPLHRC